MTNFVGFFEKHFEILGKKTKGHLLSLVKVVLFIEFKSEIQILARSIVNCKTIQKDYHNHELLDYLDYTPTA